MKQIAMILALLALLLCACGSERAAETKAAEESIPAADSAPAVSQSAPAAEGQSVDLDTDRIVVSSIFESPAWDITDPMTIQEIANAADLSQWVESAPEEMIPAVSEYTLDFQNGTRISTLADGYIQLNGDQYQVNPEFTDKLNEVLGIPEPEGFSVDFQTDCITVYALGAEPYDITDPETRKGLEVRFNIQDWPTQTEPGDQVTAEPSWVLDLNNGTCIAWLGDGYFLVGTAAQVSEDSIGVQDGAQYQMDVDMAEEIEALVKD